MALEAQLKARWERQFQRKQSASLHAIAFLMAALATWLIGQGIAANLGGDSLVSNPVPVVTCAIGAVAALLLWLLAHTGVYPGLFGRIAQLGWIVCLPLGPVFGVASVFSYATAEEGPLLRAQIIRVSSRGRTFIRSTSTILALQDGTRVKISGAAGSRHRCLSVRRLAGSFGFAWIRIEDGSPAPGPGQLNWPIARKHCFSDRALATLRG